MAKKKTKEFNFKKKAIPDFPLSIYDDSKEVNRILKEISEQIKEMDRMGDDYTSSHPTNKSRIEEINKTIDEILIETQEKKEP